MLKNRDQSFILDLAPFDRHFFTGKEKFTLMGRGGLGGKAHGLAVMKEILETHITPRFLPDIHVGIPTLTVIATDVFDLFMKENRLSDVALSDLRDDLICLAFQKTELPVQLVGDLRALISQVHTPLAIRSSSLLEDAIFEPFASVYATKMIPNNQWDTDTRFRKLVESIKYVYASTFFKDAKSYMRATKHTTADEKMAIIIQEVVGNRYGDRFYPHLSGVARSHNYYPLGHAKPGDGVIDLALGLGKSIVDDGVGWSFSPAFPQANPPYVSINDLLEQSQTGFWAINMGQPGEYNPIKETEFMLKFNLADAEEDGTLRFIASTYRPQDDKIVFGIADKGPRIVDFAPILKLDLIPLNTLLRTLLKIAEDTLERMVEIEFALTFDEKRGTPARFGFLQVRPMVVSEANVDVALSELSGKNVLVASESVLGNGFLENIQDVVYVIPEKFNIHQTQEIAAQLEVLNQQLMASGKPYLLLGFGRWGSSDPQGGIPVNFGQISGAKAIVESTLPDMNFMLSQGSHFFHNITSFRVLYFSVPHWEKYEIDWNWLKRQNAVSETESVRLVELCSPLTIKVDGRTSRGVIYHA
jgi:Pyruvate phosphate dikinase, AMP/ATP-binding domain